MSLGFGRVMLCSCIVVAILAGCGGSQSLIGAPGAAQLSVRQSPPLPAASGDASFPQYKTSGPLLYVSNDGEAHNVTVYRADSKGGRADFRGSAAKQRSVIHLYHAAFRNATAVFGARFSSTVLCTCARSV